MKQRVVEHWLPLLLWVFVIFFFSTDRFASGETSRIIVPILMFFFPRLSPHELEAWHGAIRKLGHISEYFILAIFVYRSLKHEQNDLAKAKVRAIVFVVFAAMLDEIHQRFTALRTPSPIDVGYDCLGAVSALWLITTYEARRLRTHTFL